MGISLKSRQSNRFEINPLCTVQLLVKGPRTLSRTQHTLCVHRRAPKRKLVIGYNICIRKSVWAVVVCCREETALNRRRCRRRPRRHCHLNRTRLCRNVGGPDSLLNLCFSYVLRWAKFQVCRRYERHYSTSRRLESTTQHPSPRRWPIAAVMIKRSTCRLKLALT